MYKKLLLIDIDDTICNANQAYERAAKSCFNYLKKLKPNLTLNIYNKFYNLGRKEIKLKLGKFSASSHNRYLYFQSMFELMKIPIKPEQLDIISNLYWSETNKHLKLFPTVKETFKILKGNNIKIGVVSDLLAQVQINKLKHLKIAGMIDFVVTSEETGKDKPDPVIFQVALKKAKCAANETVMVGNDCERDISGADRLNITSVYLGKRKCPKADFNIIKFKEVLPIIKSGTKLYKSGEGYIKFNYDWIKSPPLPEKDILMMNKYRSRLYKLGLIGAYKNKIGFGNISQRTSGNKFIISGTETGNIANLTGDHYAEVVKYNFSKNQLTCTGPIVASSESLSHAIIYQSDKKINSIIHIHNLKLWQKLYGKIPTTGPKAPFGSVAMVKEIKKLFKTANLKQKKIMVMGGHREGLTAFGRSFNEAYSIILGCIKN